MSSKKYAVIGLVILFVVAAEPLRKCAATDRENGDWDVTASAKQHSNKQWILDVVAKFTGKTSVEVQCADLPGNWEYATIVCAVRSESMHGSPLVQIYPLADIPAGSVQVEPGQVSKQAINLSQRFPKLAATLEGSSVVVFWTCQIGTSRRAGGWVEIPKRK